MTIPLSLEVVSLSQHPVQHHHDHYQMVVGLAGHSEFSMYGANYGMSAGVGCAVEANVEHSFCGDADNQVLVMNMPLSDPSLSCPLPSASNAAPHSGYFQLDARSLHLISLLMAEQTQYPDDSAMHHTITQTLFGMLQHRFVNVPPKKGGMRLDMALIDAHIQRRLHCKISVAELASVVFLAQSQFYALFKAQMGITPHQYVLRQRLDAAQQLIKEGQLPLSHIAQQCGFASQSSFSQAFSRLNGIPPARYQYLHRHIHSA